MAKHNFLIALIIAISAMPLNMFSQRTQKPVILGRKWVAVTGKPIAAICHAAQLLVTADAVRGKSCSAYPAVGPDVTAAGGKYVEIAMDAAHVDGNLVTAPAWPAHPAWLAKFLEVLGTRIQP